MFSWQGQLEAEMNVVRSQREKVEEEMTKLKQEMFAEIESLNNSLNEAEVGCPFPRHWRNHGEQVSRHHTLGPINRHAKTTSLHLTPEFYSFPFFRALSVKEN